MTTARAVIGAAFGDEGKGLMTDKLVTSESTVVRFNGGAQAGHTVKLKDGRRHVFHHFGSGSFRGATTYLSRFFISNPMLYAQEFITLRRLGVVPRVVADPAGLVTTPYDMMINQMTEDQRGFTRHGTCGNGINETMKRSEHPEFRLTVGDLANEARLRVVFKRIRERWIPQRLADLRVRPTDDYRDHLQSDAIQNHYFADALAYYAAIEVQLSYLRDQSDIVFEGAQGLLLDEDHRYFPHVTHSHTGLKNVNTLVVENGIDALRVIYMTRAYTTRHGPGPFEREVAGLKYEDRTNVPNDWQGTLRFGHLDLNLLNETIQHDLTHATVPVQPVLAITCLDQVGSEVPVWQGGTLHHVATAELPQMARKALHMPVRFTSVGPTAEDVTVHA